MTVPSTATPGRLHLALGLGLAALGLLGYVVQLTMKNLMTPWYLPAAATLGLFLVAVSLRRKRSLWRGFALALALLIAGAAWTFLLATRLPPYTGPVVVGKPFPAFATTQAAGTPFTQHDLKGDRNNVMVFFRGRW